MKLLSKITLLLFTLVSFVGCEKNDIPIFDVENGRAIAGFNGQEFQRIVFNPAAETTSTLRVGISTVSSSDRTFVISVDPSSTLAPEYYSIDNLNPVVQAGDFTADINITTIPGEALPSGTASLILNIESVENAEIGENSVQSLEVGLAVECPDVDISALPGNYQVTASTFAAFFGETDFTREVVAGPGANQITIVGGTYIQEGAEDLILTIDPETGDIIGVDDTKISSQVSFGPNFYKLNPGGRVLTCAGIIEVNLDFAGSIAGNPHVFNLIKID
ncbi:DUF1735 domain-containing protein [Robertkochia aurantiaca]|uniref:DUF1735 domain-containing protein n=1 Tax=Robertkochia aurantiaca TaxID=2873700 RepID=UPI001CCBAFBD|nr:DUF1735 domain-containing protein [Robertkochia sp. 3YJGBD-33]